MLVLSHCKLNLKTLNIMNPRFLSRVIVHMGQGPDTVSFQSVESIIC